MVIIPFINYLSLYRNLIREVILERYLESKLFRLIFHQDEQEDHLHFTLQVVSLSLHFFCSPLIRPDTMVSGRAAAVDDDLASCEVVASSLPRKQRVRRLQVGLPRRFSFRYRLPWTSLGWHFLGCLGLIDGPSFQPLVYAHIRVGETVHADKDGLRLFHVKHFVKPAGAAFVMA